MKTTSVKYALAAVVLLSTLNPPLSTVLAQGSLTPPGAPAPTMKSLTQIEPRTPISSAPFIIANAGSYYLTTNLTVTTGDAITIATNGVTLDLSGFSIFSTAPSATGSGIRLLFSVPSKANDPLRNLTIVNGFIQGGVTNYAGTYNGPGFGYGIRSSGTPWNVRVAGVSVSGCLYNGIHLYTGGSTVVESCTVRTVGGSGIVASTVRSSVALDCGGGGIGGSQVSDSRGDSTGSGAGVGADVVLNCVGQSSGGYGIQASTAQNCSGWTWTSSYGLYASTAQNCYGGSSYYGAGGGGLYADSALNCQGYAPGSGTGLSAVTALNCYGYSSGGTGLSAAYTAIGCRGGSYSGTGLSANIANSCSGSSVSATYKYDMP